MSRVTRLPKMSMPSAPPPTSLVSSSGSPTPTTPLEISQQLQRVEILHQQLKAEAQRAQEFLAKLRRGELEAQSQNNLQTEERHHHRYEDQQDERRRTTGDWEGDADTGRCTCSRSHHLGPPTQPTSNGSHHPITNNGTNANGLKDSTVAPLAFPPRVDEREVRDLEKRVRGLEGRVRGFEGLPPDRELALLEVERLRRELEGLARRREGLFEGLGYEDAIRLGRPSDANARVKSDRPSSSSEATPTGPSRGSRPKAVGGTNHTRSSCVNGKSESRH